MTLSFSLFTTGVISRGSNSGTNWRHSALGEREVPARTLLAGFGQGSRQHPHPIPLLCHWDRLLLPRISTSPFAKLREAKACPLRYAFQKRAWWGGRGPCPASRVQTPHRLRPWPLALTYFPSRVNWQLFDVTLAWGRSDTHHSLKKKKKAVCSASKQL